MFIHLLRLSFSGPLVNVSEEAGENPKHALMCKFATAIGAVLHSCVNLCIFIAIFNLKTRRASYSLLNNLHN